MQKPAEPRCATTKSTKEKETLSLPQQKKKAVFDQRFVEGTFVPLRKYASQRGLDASETVLDTDLAILVMDKFGERVKRCEVTGVLGIELLDGAAVGEYRFRRRSHNAQNVTADKPS